MTTETFRIPAARMWRIAEVVGTIIAVGAAVLITLGWRFEKPGERIVALETRVTRLEQMSALIASQLETTVRMQCLMITRRDANFAGACVKYPTREETTRAVPVP